MSNALATYWRENLFAAGDSGLIVRPKFYANPPLPGVLNIHGAGGNSVNCQDTIGRQNLLLREVVTQGRVLVNGDWGGPETWGNDLAMARISMGYNTLQSLYGVKSGKVALLGGSMGGLNALVWAAANPTLVSCIVTVIPVIDLNDVVTGNRGGYGSTASAAYSGGWSQAVYGATHNPLTMASAGRYAQIPILAFYGTADLLCLPSKLLEFAAAVGSSVTLVPIAGLGHSYDTWSAMDHDQVAAFLAQYAT